MTTWNTIYQIDWTGATNTGTGGAGSTVGPAPPTYGTAFGAPVDVNGSTFQISSGQMFANNNAHYSNYGSLGWALKIPTGVLTLANGVHIRSYGDQGDHPGPSLFFGPGATDSDALTIQSTGTQIILQTAGGSILASYGVTVAGKHTLDAAIRRPTATEVTNLGLAAGQLVCDWNVSAGNNTTWTGSGTMAVPTDAPATGRVWLGNRVTHFTNILVETAIPIVVGPLVVNQGLSLGGLVVECPILDSSGGTVSGSLYYYEGQSSTRSLIQTKTIAGDGTLRFNLYTPVDGLPHFYGCDITDLGVVYPTSQYLAGYPGGALPSVAMPASYPFAVVPTLAPMSAAAQAAINGAVGIAGDSRGTGLLASPFQTVSGNGSLSVVNGSLGGTAWSDWKPSASNTSCPIGGQSGKSLFNGLRDALLAVSVAAGQSRWVILTLGTNGFAVANGNPQFERDVRDTIAGFVAAGIKVMLQLDDARIYSTSGMEVQMNQNLFYIAASDRVNSFASDGTLNQWFWNNVATVSADGVHHLDYTNRSKFIATSWGNAVTASLPAAGGGVLRSQAMTGGYSG